MDKPTIAQQSPFAVNLEEGKKYAWCSCGRSSNQPFCDGGHIGTAFKPIVFTADETKSTYLCGCKSSANGPFCDGAHKGL